MERMIVNRYQDYREAISFFFFTYTNQIPPQRIHVIALSPPSAYLFIRHPQLKCTPLSLLVFVKHSITSATTAYTPKLEKEAADTD